MKLLKQALLIAITGLFCISQFYIHSTYSYTGFFILALILISLQKFDFKQIAIISSIIITYPAAWILTYLLSGPTGMNLLLILLIFIIYTVVYMRVLKDIWTWIDPKLALTFTVTASTLFVIAIFFTSQVVSCLHISAAEKGVSAEAIKFCKNIGQYRENFSYTSKVGLLFMGKYFESFITVYLPIIITTIAMMRSFIINEKNHNENISTKKNHSQTPRKLLSTNTFSTNTTG